MMLNLPQTFRSGYRILVAWLLLFGLLGQALAVCTDEELGSWREGNGWKPGAMVWAGTDNIPSSTIPGGAPVKDLEFNAPALPIRDAKQKPDNNGKKVWWLQIEQEKRLVWIPAYHPGVLCRSTPLKVGNSTLFRKVIARTWNRQGEKTSVTMRLHPPENGEDGAEEDMEKDGIRVFDYFFVYAEHGEWRLLGREDTLYPFEPTLLGWVHEKDLIRWDSRQVARPRPLARFLDRVDGDEIEDERIIAWTKETWGGKDIRRPPIIGPSRSRNGQDYLPIALPVDIDAHHRHSKNLERLAEALGKWGQPTILFLVDGTESTAPYLKAIHALLGTLLTELDQAGRDRGLTLQYALYSYTDTAYGPGFHTRRYQGATEEIWSIRRAFKLLMDDTDQITVRSGSDDYPEDLYAGIQRVREEVLNDDRLQNSLPVLVVIGDHGGHERTLSRHDARALLEDKNIVPYFIQVGRRDPHVGPNLPCRNPDRLNRREQRYCAFQRFEEDARFLLGERFRENETFFRGEDPRVSAKAVESVLNDMFRQRGHAGLVVDGVKLGKRWKDATKGWPLVYSQAFRALLRSQGYDETVLDNGEFVAVREAWVAESDIEPEVFITKSEIHGWIEIFKRMARPELWSTERVEGILIDHIGIHAKETLWNTPLYEALAKRAGLPLQDTELLGITMSEIENLDRERLADYARMFRKYQKALEGIAAGDLYRTRAYRMDDERILTTQGKPVPKDVWFRFAPHVEAAYIELRYLP